LVPSPALVVAFTGLICPFSPMKRRIGVPAASTALRGKLSRSARVANALQIRKNPSGSRSALMYVKRGQVRPGLNAPR